MSEIESDGAPQGMESGTGHEPRPPASRRRPARVVAAAAAAAAVIIVAVVAAVVLPGSSSPKAGSDLTPTQIVTIAARNSAKLNSVSATLTEHVSGTTSVTVTGKVTEQRNPLLLSMNISENAGSTHVPISAIITAHTIYLKFSANSFGMPEALAHKWIKIPVARLGAGSFFATMMRSVQSDNPLSQPQLLIGAEHLRAVGTQAVGGVSTTKYTGSFSPSAAVKDLTPSLRTELSPMLKLITRNVDVSIWIDGQNRIRKLLEVEHVGAATATVICTFDRLNQPVHITLPSASQVLTPPASALSAA